MGNRSGAWDATAPACPKVNCSHWNTAWGLPHAYAVGARCADWNCGWDVRETATGTADGLAQTHIQPFPSC